MMRVDTLFRGAGGGQGRESRQVHETYDVLVIGAGVAGLRAAIALAEAGLDVGVATKDDPRDSSSGQAKGGIAVVLSGEEHQLVLHEEDTLAAGAGLCDPAAVRVLVRDGADEVRRLIDWGARFDREGNRFHLTREAAHSLPRILHAGGDATGREIVRTLIARVRGESRVQRLEGGMVCELLLDQGRCVGARLAFPGGRCRRVLAGRVLLATGGMGRCWQVTSNPPEATGDGLALALRAGCVLGDMEFVQFHPTSLAIEGAPPFLLTEALRGEGGTVRNEQGERFLLEEDPRGELAPRDIVARGIAREIQRQRGRPVHLDLSGIDPAVIGKRFPGVIEACRSYGLDPLEEMIPVRPAAHYAMGGVVTDLEGRTNVPGLYAAGEVASTGVHGANRLASNSLLEGLVFGARAARAMLADRLEEAPAKPPEAGPAAYADPEAVAGLRHLAETRLGIVRRAEDLARAVTELEAAAEKLTPRQGQGVDQRLASEAGNMIQVLGVVARSALWREESRGGHYRDDFPEIDDARFRVHSRLTIDGRVSSHPVG